MQEPEPVFQSQQAFVYPETQKHLYKDNLKQYLKEFLFLHLDYSLHQDKNHKQVCFPTVSFHPASKNCEQAHL